MYKHILLAALLGVAVAGKGKSVMSWTKADTLVANDYITLTYDIDADLYYGTGYEGGQYTGSDAPLLFKNAFNYEKYFLIVATYLEAGFTLDFMGLYQVTPRIYIEPFTVHPWEQWFLWFRPVSDDYDFSLFDVNIYSSVYWECGKAYLTWEEHLDVFQKSVVDYALLDSNYDLVPDQRADWTYNIAQQEEYTDGFWDLSIWENIPYFADSDFVNSDWFGEISILNLWIRRKWNW